MFSKFTMFEGKMSWRLTYLIYSHEHRLRNSLGALGSLPTYVLDKATINAYHNYVINGIAKTNTHSSDKGTTPVLRVIYFNLKSPQ